MASSCLKENDVSYESLDEQRVSMRRERRLVGTPTPVWQVVGVPLIGSWSWSRCAVNFSPSVRISDFPSLPCLTTSIFRRVI